MPWLQSSIPARPTLRCPSSAHWQCRCSPRDTSSSDWRSAIALWKWPWNRAGRTGKQVAAQTLLLHLVAVSGRAEEDEEGVWGKRWTMTEFICKFRAPCTEEQNGRVVGPFLDNYPGGDWLQRSEWLQNCSKEGIQASDAGAWPWEARRRVIIAVRSRAC